MRAEVIYLFVAIASLQLNECTPFMDFLRNVFRAGKVSFLSKSQILHYYRNYGSEGLERNVKAYFDVIYEIFFSIKSLMRKREKGKEREREGDLFRQC